eukprot:Tbor_TRINITY_DN3257_c0_g1::TRINITY_DN3257_c0_g1_i1::g.23716::m.23716
MPTKSRKVDANKAKNYIMDPFHFGSISDYGSHPSMRLLRSINEAEQYTYQSRAAVANITVYPNVIDTEKYKQSDTSSDQCHGLSVSNKHNSINNNNKVSTLLSPRIHGRDTNTLTLKEETDIMALRNALRKSPYFKAKGIRNTKLSAKLTTNRAAYSNLLLEDDASVKNDGSSSSVTSHFRARSTKPLPTKLLPYATDCPSVVGIKSTTYRITYSPRYDHGMKGGIGNCRNVLLKNGENIPSKLSCMGNKLPTMTPWEEASIFNATARQAKAVLNESFDSLINTTSSNEHLPSISSKAHVPVVPHVNIYKCSSASAKSELAMDFQQNSELTGLRASTIASRGKTEEARRLREEYEVTFDSPQYEAFIQVAETVADRLPEIPTLNSH